MFEAFPLKKRETQLNEVFKVFLKNGNASKFCRNTSKKKVFKNTETPQKKRENTSTK